MLFHIFAASNLDLLSKSYEKEIACGKEILKNHCHENCTRKVQN